MTEQQQIATNTFLEKLTEQLKGGTNTESVFGPPVERGGMTVIPVARARWGVGGGQGTQPGDSSPTESRQQAMGSGGGGGAMVSPVGFIELRDDGARFRPIRNPALMPMVALAAGALVISAISAVSQLVTQARARRRFFR